MTIDSNLYHILSKHNGQFNRKFTKENSIIKPMHIFIVPTTHNDRRLKSKFIMIKMILKLLMNLLLLKFKFKITVEHSINFSSFL